MEKIVFQRNERLNQISWPQDDIETSAPTAEEKLAVLIQMNKDMRVTITEQGNQLAVARKKLQSVQQEYQDGRRIADLYTQLAKRQQDLQEKKTFKPEIDQKTVWLRTLRW
ncbi:hypothetical protein CP370_09635, partial [Lactobacillus sp. UMNPBX19]